MKKRMFLLPFAAAVMIMTVKDAEATELRTAVSDALSSNNTVTNTTGILPAADETYMNGVPVTTALPAATTPAVTTPAVTTPAATTPASATPTATTPAAVKTVDLVIFAGQSNMSGRGGNARAAPKVANDTGYEFRYGSCAAGLYPVTEPFGIYSTGCLADPPALRSGSLASAFMNSYYVSCGVPVLGFSAARGGSSIAYWQMPVIQSELSQKYDYILAWCKTNNVYIRKKYVVWLQGETDGVANVSKETYEMGLKSVFSRLFAKGLDRVFVIPIGKYAGLPGTYDKIRAAQIGLCKSDARFTLGSDALGILDETYLADGCHYNQAALNMAGSECGAAAARMP